MKNYAEMTNVEIDRTIFELKFGKLGTDKDALRFWNDGNFRPCNSWSDAGPIIEKHLICLAADVFAEPQDGGKWVAQPAYGWQHERVRHDNPLRAAMIVFLMMHENDNS